jgi:sensor histidine kinase regulating citrate/malate metabolism
MSVRARSLRTRLLWGTLLIIAVVMTAVMLVVEHRQRTAIVDEVQRRGEVLARGLAATAQAPLLLYNFTALEQNVAQAAAEDDVPYAIVLDADGRVAAHSERPERVGMVLHGALDRRAVETTGPLVQETTTDTGEGIYDFAIPIVVGHQK